mgnify:FL=1
MQADSMSIWSLVSGAGLVVQAVMLLLVLLSVMSWAMIVVRFRTIGQARKVGRAFENDFWASNDLASLYQVVKGDTKASCGQRAIFKAGFEEFIRLTKTSRDADAVMEGAQRAMRVALQREQNRLYHTLPFLATVGSTSPYIGLFGTVWGIMNSFRALANVTQASLAVVAPGIAEALVATAMGLFAAIPAVVAYNRFAAAAEEIIGECEIFAEEFSAMLHRQVHKHREN